MKIILVADKDSKLRNLIHLIFTEDTGYRVLSTSSGEEAVSKAKMMIPDVVLADVSLPDKDGYEISREIKDDPHLKNTSVILVAESVEAFDKAKADEVYADEVIRKPFEAAEIKKKVEFLTIRKEEAIGSFINLNEKRKIRFFDTRIALSLIFIMAVLMLLYNAAGVDRLKIESEVSGLYSRLKNFAGVSLSGANPITYEEMKKEAISVMKRENIKEPESVSETLSSETGELNGNEIIDREEIKPSYTETRTASLMPEKEIEPPKILRRTDPSGVILRKEIEKKGYAPEEPVIVSSLKRKDNPASPEQKETPRIEIEKPEVKRSEGAGAEDEKLATASIPPIQPNGKYTVQVGAFKTAKKADNVARSLTSKGYPAFVTTAKTSRNEIWHVIRVGAFETRDQSEQFGDYLEKHEPTVKQAVVISRDAGENKLQVSQKTSPVDSSDAISAVLKDIENKKPDYDEARFKVIEEIKRQKVLSDLEKKVAESENRKVGKEPTFEEVHRLIKDVQTKIEE